MPPDKILTKQVIKNPFFSIKILLFFFCISLSSQSFSQDHHGENTHAEASRNKEDKTSIKKKIKEYIFHHLGDSYYFDIYSYDDDAGHHKYVGFPLPVILWDKGLKVFLSSGFKHGKSIVSKGETHYKLYHEKIYKTDSEGTIHYDDHHHVTNAKPFDLSITKNVFNIFVVALLMLWLFISLAKSYAKNGNIAKGFGRFFEPIILYIRDDIAIPNIGEKKYKKYMSFLLTVFFFIWFSDMLGLTPFGVNITGNITVTFCLAILVFVITNITANKNYWQHIFWMPGVPMPVKILLAPIELLGVFLKPFSLMIRLYANISAGHIILMSIIGLIFIFKTWLSTSLSFMLAFALTLLEVLVALLQAYIFTMLSALYFGFANEEKH